MSEIPNHMDANGTSQTYEHIDSNRSSEKNAESAPTSDKKSLPVKKGGGLLAAGFRSQQNFDEPVQADAITEGTQYHKYSFFWVSTAEDEVYDIIMEFPGFSTIEDAIRKAIPEFNMKFLQLNKPFRLSDDPADFQMYHAKKNGKPKLDYPSFYPTQNLNQLGVSLLTLKEKDTSKGVVYSEGRKTAGPPQIRTAQPSMAQSDRITASDGSQMKPFEQMTPKSKDYPKGNNSSEPLSVQRTSEAANQKEEPGCCAWLSNCLGLNKKNEVDEKRQPVLKNQMP